MGLVTDAQRDLMRHALGLPHPSGRSWRNHYVVGGGEDHAAWSALVMAGLACHRPGRPITGGDDLFWLTRAGGEVALEPGERLGTEHFRGSQYFHRPKGEE